MGLSTTNALKKEVVCPAGQQLPYSEVNMRSPLSACNKAREREDQPGLWNPEKTSPEDKKKGYQWPMQKTDILHSTMQIQ